MLFQNHLPFWGDRFCIILLWTLFAWCFRYMNGIDGIASLQASGFVCGLLILPYSAACRSYTAILPQHCLVP